MDIVYEVYNPGGNITALVTSPVSKDYLIWIAKYILKYEPSVEQVGKVKKEKPNKCKLWMSGGEFCGNACRSAAAYMNIRFGQPNSQIYINGIKVEASSTAKSNTITLNKADLIQEIKCLGVGETLIIQKDMTQLIIQESSKLYGKEINKEKAQKIKDDYKLDNKAVAIVFLDNNSKIRPFVWVKDVDSFYEETACLSASISSAIVLSNGKNNFETRIIQPSSEVFNIKVSDTITVSGKCQLSRVCKIAQSKLQSFIYGEIENQFISLSQLNQKFYVVDTTNQEKLKKFENAFCSVLVRESVYKKLSKIDQELNKFGQTLKVFCGYRSFALQTAMWNEALAQLKPLRLTKTELYEVAHRQVAMPKVAGHVTGGAVDVGIVDIKSGKLLDFGIKYLEYGAGKRLYISCPFISSAARKNRQKLKRLMEKEDFYNFPGEWWHFSYGDREWSVSRGQNQVLYDRV